MQQATRPQKVFQIINERVIAPLQQHMMILRPKFRGTVSTAPLKTD